MTYYRKHVSMGRPIHYATWLALWMDMNHFSINGFARLLCYSDMAIKNWRMGRSISHHAALLIRSRWPDAPVPMRGGLVPKINNSLPVYARTPRLYKFLLKKMGMIRETIIPWPVAVEKARGIIIESQPKQIPMSSGEVNPDGV